MNPAGQEVCDPEDTDEDCNGVADDADSGVDPSTQTTWYADEDEDGFGDPDRYHALYAENPTLGLQHVVAEQLQTAGSTRFSR